MLILTTGGLGFIGSHTTIALIKKGFDVLIVDSLINSKKETLNNIKKIIDKETKKLDQKLYFEEGDIRDEVFLKDVFKKYREKQNPIQTVIHFAGLKSVEESVRHPLSYWETNINLTLNLLKIMDLFSCNKLIFSSSATIYKPDKFQKLLESSPIDPINPYGNTKLSIEKIIEDYYFSKSGEFKFINLRYFNPVGAHDSGFIGEDPKINSQNIIPKILQVIKKDIPFLPIYGDDWPTEDGTCVRDYIHVMDLAEAHLSALLFLINNENIRLNLNIGTGRGVSVLKLINTFKKVNNCKLPYIYESRRKGDVPYLVANNSLALKLLKWFPKKSLEDICKDIWIWQK